MITAKTHFDWIIVDTPPVMAVADATLVAHLATGVLFVVGAEMTSRHAAKRALDQLEHVHAKFVGGVLNKVDLHRNPYYYSQYYRREYAQYYSQGVLSHGELDPPARSTRNVDARHQCSVVAPTQKRRRRFGLLLSTRTLSSTLPPSTPTRIAIRRWKSRRSTAVISACAMESIRGSREL